MWGRSVLARALQQGGVRWTRAVAAVAAGGGLAAGGGVAQANMKTDQALKQPCGPAVGVVPAAPGKKKRDPKELPTLTVADVTADHGDRIWVTWKGGVYDVTDFLDAHPGGASRIEMAQGQDLSGFWHIYNFHQKRVHIMGLLEEYRIGNLSAADQKKMETDVTSNLASMYQNDPKRPRAAEGKLRIPTTMPWNHEPADLRTLVETFYTPNDMFFVRNHNAVPEIDGDEWCLEIEKNPDAGIMQDYSFSLKDLREKFPQSEVISALQCAGNRQEDFITPDRPLYVAPHWRGAAIGNAKWKGPRVRDILKACGMDVDGYALGTKEYPDCKIVNFIGADIDETGVPYAGVLPLQKVADPFGDTILALDMNGETLPRDHGFPGRILAPGHAGCRNVKWCNQIIVSKAASELDSGSKLDRHFAPDVDFMEHLRWGDDHVRLDQGPVIQTQPVTSVICDPPMPHQVYAGKNVDTIDIRGVAWAGGGRGICRAEVSIDGGKTFTAAEQQRLADAKAFVPPEAGQGRNWSWQQFKQTMPLTAEMKKQLKAGQKVDLEITMRAVDGDFNKQPERMAEAWNVLGICANHWHRVKVTLDPKYAKGDRNIPAPKPLPQAGYPLIN